MPTHSHNFAALITFDIWVFRKKDHKTQDKSFIQLSIEVIQVSYIPILDIVCHPLISFCVTSYDIDDIECFYITIHVSLSF